MGSETTPQAPELVQRLCFDTLLSYPQSANGEAVFVNSSVLCVQLVNTSTGLNLEALADVMIGVYKEVNSDPRSWSSNYNYPLLWSNKIAKMKWKTAKTRWKTAMTNKI